MILRLAWRNLWRQPRRTILSLLSIAFTMAVTVWMLGLQQGVYSHLENNYMHILHGYAQIQPRGYADDPVIERSIDQPEELQQKIAALGFTAAPRASTYAILSTQKLSRGAALLGVVPAAETGLSAIPAGIVEGRYLNNSDRNAVVLGALLARILHVGVGGSITFLATARDGTIAADRLTVVGIFKSGIAELDRQFAEMPLPLFQQDFALGNAVNFIAIGGDSLDSVNRKLPELQQLATQAGLVAKAWYELEPGLHQAIHLDATISTFWYAMLLIVVTFIILNTLLMTVLERTREFGMVLAVGARRSLLGRIVWVELMILVLLSALIGMSAGAAVVLWQSLHGLVLPGSEAIFRQWGMSGVLHPTLTPFSLFTGPGLITAAVMCAGLFPYLRIRKLEPVPAMRAV